MLAILWSLTNFTWRFVIFSLRLSQPPDYSNYNNELLFPVLGLNNEVWNYDNLDREWVNTQRFHYSVLLQLTCSVNLNILPGNMHNTNWHFRAAIRYVSAVPWRYLAHTCRQTHNIATTHTVWCTSRHASHHYLTPPLSTVCVSRWGSEVLLLKQKRAASLPSRKINTGITDGPFWCRKAEEPAVIRMNCFPPWSPSLIFYVEQIDR